MSMKTLACLIFTANSMHAFPEGVLDSSMIIHMRSVAFRDNLMGRADQLGGACFVGTALPSVAFVPQSVYGFAELIISRMSPVDELAPWTAALAPYSRDRVDIVLLSRTCQYTIEALLRAKAMIAGELQPPIETPTLGEFKPMMDPLLVLINKLRRDVRSNRQSYTRLSDGML